MNWPEITSLLARFGGNLHLDVSLIWLAFFLWFYGGYLVLTGDLQTMVP